MKILVLTKRRYMGKDVLDDGYGRFYEIPKALAAQGHAVRGICLDYYRAGWTRERELGGVLWSSYSARRIGSGGLTGWLRASADAVSAFEPDVVVGSSDAINIAAAQRIAGRRGTQFVADLYDNFESYGLCRVPGAKAALRSAVRKADGVVCVSEQLRDFVADQYRPRGELTVIENAVPAGMFLRRDRDECRRRLNLPGDLKLVGIAGALTANRGIETVYAAYRNLAQRRPDIGLALAGPSDRDPATIGVPRVYYLGRLPYEDVPHFLGALDVGIVANEDSAFGRYCFPQKAQELLACGIPIVAARVGVMAQVLRECPRCLFEPGDAASLERAIEAQLADRRHVDVEVPTWSDQARKLARFMEGLCWGV